MQVLENCQSFEISCPCVNIANITNSVIFKDFPKYKKGEHTMQTLCVKCVRHNKDFWKTFIQAFVSFLKHHQR